MKQPIFLKNIPINEKRISFIESVVSRLCRRQKSQAHAMITPFPISNAVFGTDVKGVVMSYMFPCEGVITKGLIDIGTALKKGVMLSLNVTNTTHSEAKAYVVTRNNFLASPDIKVDSGDKLSVAITPNDPEESISEVWVSFLWVPSVKEVEVKNFLLDEILDDTDNE